VSHSMWVLHGARLLSSGRHCIALLAEHNRELYGKDLGKWVCDLGW
jgi:hypothetical protein